MKKNPEIIIIGAGPVGAYFAGKLGAARVKVEVFEARSKENVRKELGYVHFDVWSYKALDLPRPSSKEDFHYGTFTDNWQIPLTENKKFSVPYEVDILSINGFISWIVKHSENTGNVVFNYEAPFIEPIIDGNMITGVKIDSHGEVNAKIIIDCSGRKAVVRNSLPKECGVQKLKARPNRTFSLYMEKWKCDSDFPKGSNTYVCFKGFANQVGSIKTLIGLSSLFGFQHAKESHKELVNYHLPGIAHDVESKFSGKVPYDFPPRSLVGNGFLCAGDAAFQNKPFNGEGMASGMEAASIAVPVIVEALKNKKVMAEDLWAYNSQYFKGIGAKFALIRGTGETLVDLSAKDFDWMYKANIITKKDILSTWLRYSMDKGPFSVLKSTFKALGNLPLLGKMFLSMRLGISLSSHCKKYPSNPKGFENWEEKLLKILEKRSIIL